MTNALKTSNPLIKVLEKMAAKERWIKKPKTGGVLCNRRESISGNLILEFEENAQNVIVLKKNRNLFSQAQGLKDGQDVRIVGRRWLGKLYAERITKKKPQEETLLRFMNLKS